MSVSGWVNASIFVLTIAGAMVAIISSQKERQSWWYHMIYGLVTAALIATSFAIFYFSHVIQNGHT